VPTFIELRRRQSRNTARVKNRRNESNQDNSPRSQTFVLFVSFYSILFLNGLLTATVNNISIKSVRGILLDIEGTTSSISFVYDVMFPYVLRELDSYLRRHREDPGMQKLLDEMARTVDDGMSGFSNAEDWFTAEASPLLGAERSAPFEQRLEIVKNTVQNEMSCDRKTTWLKQLQGLIWKDGFESGELKAHVYDDVPAALAAWNAAGKDVRIYSSGSIQAQKLFFGHTISGNLLPHFRGHYDTSTGPKKETESYQRIATDFDLPPPEILFLSDVVAGGKSAHRVIENFAQLKLV
jgi:enolase-phosphatase E1